VERGSSSSESSAKRLAIIGVGFAVGASLDLDFEDFPKPIREGDLSLDFFSGFDDFGERRLGAAPALPRIEERM
jgi:hypothetical protein